ncbi:MAG: UDP-D-galactose:(glucosyl)lipopolysaccharide-1, 6-D-galactosyltransferase [Candidatus Bathyarchaeota archaeon BA1]|nr:MAG: UDP-D-galactose:(glucosyl)lipopolysaccharide-1, 6-D-galactosyltransferase [Candidatus Bathyarchaeota archaeon BA1]
MTDDLENRYTPRFLEARPQLLRSDSYSDSTIFSTVRKLRKRYSIAFYSPLLGESSWTLVGMELMNELDKLGIPTYIIPWSISEKINQIRFKKRVLPRNTIDLELIDIHQYIKLLHLKAIIRLSHPDSFHVIHAFRQHYPNLKLIGYSVAESDSINEIWVDGCNTMDQVWGTSRFTCDVYRKSGVKVPIYYAPHGVKTDLFKPENADGKLRKRLKLDNKFVIVYVGRVDGRKNLPALIRAYAMIERPDTQLVIHGDKRSQDLELIRKLGIRNVTYTEDIGMRVWSVPHRHMPKIYGLALGRRRGCHVLPSHSEGFGMTLVEAGAMGLPCIAVDWSAPPEIILEGKTGLLIPISGFEEVAPFISSGGTWACFKEEKLADLIDLLYANPNLCEEMGERAIEHVKENFTWKKAAEYAFKALCALVEDSEKKLWRRVRSYYCMYKNN